MRILIADDNVDAAQTLATLLEMLGYSVQVAYDGASALERAAQFAPQVIVCDIGMPRVDGYAVARDIRELDPAGGRPLMIACTGYGNAADREAALQAGFDHHLTKPVVIPDLLRLLANHRDAIEGKPAA